MSRFASPPDALDGAERAAIEASHLRSLPLEVIAGLSADASRLHVEAGSVVHGQGTTTPHVEVVVSGLVRVYVTAPETPRNPDIASERLPTRPCSGLPYIDKALLVYRREHGESALGGSSSVLGAGISGQ